MTKAFSMFLWENSPSVNTPLGESKLNLINTALNEVDNRVLNFDTTKANQTDLLTAVADVTFDEDTGIFTVTKKNGSVKKIDTKLEKLAINFTYDVENQRLVITLEDGTYQYVDLKALITELEFLNSDTVLFSVSADGKVSANIAKGSITADMLEPNYLANVQLYSSQAMSSANSAKTSAEEAEASALRAEEAADRATSAVGGDFATNTRVDKIVDGTTPVAKATNADTVDGWNFIGNPNELGFTGQLTMAQLCAALSDKQRFVWVNTSTATNGVTDVPGTYGLLVAEKRGTWCYATWIAINQKSKTPLYAGSWHSENGWTGWSSVADYLPITGAKTNGNFTIAHATSNPTLQLSHETSGTTGAVWKNANQTVMGNIPSGAGSDNSQWTTLVLSDKNETLDNLLRVTRGGTVYKVIHTGNMGTHVLPRVGGTLTGNVGIHRANHGTYSLNNTSFTRDGSVPSEMQYGNFLVYDKDGKNIGGMQNFVYTTGNIATALVTYQNTAESNYGLLGVKANADGTIKPYFYQNGSVDRDIFHTGNKPTGTYTGNGSKTERTISTGGIGSVLAIWSEYGVALVTPAGGFYGYSGSNFAHFPASGGTHNGSFTNGVLKLAATHDALNRNGVTYRYQVL